MRRFRSVFGSLLVLGAVARLVYVALLPGSDPAFAHPVLDGAFYLDWARTGVPPGGLPHEAYYLGPLYPWAVRALFAVAGERLTLLIVLQELGTVLAAALLGLAAREVATARGARADAAALAATGLALFYHPAVYFAGRPLSEPLGLVLLAAAVLAATRVLRAGRLGPAAAAGALAGLAALARPNLLAVPALWVAWWALRGRVKVAAVCAGAAVLAIAPVTARNALVSGHLVPVSANGGIVFWLGNAPGAEGVYTPADGFSGTLADQQREAIAAASATTGRAMDGAAADRYWLRRGLAARAADPWGSVRLLARRAALAVAPLEMGLDYAPRADRDPARWLFPVPFALILGLAAAGWVASGTKASGGAAVWLAAAGCALTPLLFYVSSRHRLPLAILLCVPAGAGLAAIADRRALRRTGVAAACGVLVAGLTFLVPTAGLRKTSDAAALTMRATTLLASGDLARAERDARAALDLDPASAVAAYNLAVILEKRGERMQAETIYRRIVSADPGQAEAAGNLGRLLVLRGAPAEAVPVLRGALAVRPDHAACWTNLVVALLATGDRDGARKAARAAASHGVALPEGLRAQALGEGARGAP